MIKSNRFLIAYIAPDSNKVGNINPDH